MNIITVELRFDRLYNLLGRAKLTADNQRIIEGMRANGAEGDLSWPLFVQGYEAGMKALATLLYSTPEAPSIDPETVAFEMPMAVEAEVDEWTFRHLCGYQSD